MRTCFGNFIGDDECDGCPANDLCREVLILSGFDVGSGMLDELVESLPEGEYTAPTRDLEAKTAREAYAAHAEVIAQLISGGTPTPASAMGAQATVANLDTDDL